MAAAPRVRHSVASVIGLAAAIALSACAADPPAAVVAVRAEGCAAVPAEGVGTIVDSGIVLTAAHTVAGAHTVTVDGAPARLLQLDPANDLAMLQIADRVTPPMPVRHGDRAAGVVYVRRDGAVRPLDVTIVRPVVIATTDIYREGATERPGFELAGPIVRGDSGAPLLVGGYVVGVVWARSNVAPGRAYAISADALRPDPAADASRCAAG